MKKLTNFGGIGVNAEERGTLQKSSSIIQFVASSDWFASSSPPDPATELFASRNIAKPLRAVARLGFVVFRKDAAS